MCFYLRSVCFCLSQKYIQEKTPARPPVHASPASVPCIVCTSLISNENTPILNKNTPILDKKRLVLNKSKLKTTKNFFLFFIGQRAGRMLFLMFLLVVMYLMCGWFWFGFVFFFGNTPILIKHTQILSKTLWLKSKLWKTK